MKIIIYSIFSLSVILAHADNLGVYGRTFPIIEPDLIDLIKDRAKNLINSGKWAQIQEKTISKAKDQILSPPLLENITDTKENRTVYFDPTFFLDHNIYDSEGKLIAKSGYYNPLTYKPFTAELIFINGEKSSQVEWAVNRFKTTHKKIKIILTGGKYIDLDKKYKIWFYYDQKGKYTSKFNIRHVPALAYQEGKRIRIDEIILEKAQK